jgi:magnesium transporter
LFAVTAMLVCYALEHRSHWFVLAFAGSCGTIAPMAASNDQVLQYLESGNFAKVREALLRSPPSDVAAVLTVLSPERRAVVFRLLPRRLAAATFEYLTREQQQGLLKGMAQHEVADVLNAMADDDRTALFSELPANVTKELLALLDERERKDALTLLGYPGGTVGRLMTSHYIAVSPKSTIQEVLDYVREHGEDSETLNVIYVVDEQGMLIDDIRIREVLLVDTSKHVWDLMDYRYVALAATDSEQAAVAVFRREDRTALPVTDSAGILIGIVTIDDVIDIAENEATREIQRIGGSESLDEPYTTIAFGRLVRKRASWLVILFLGEMLTATAMGFFEAEIARAVVLALFVPLIISSGGNSGSQASTLVIRALALGEISVNDWFRIMRREIRSGLALGCILGSIGFLRISIWSAFSPIYGPHWLLVALTVALALVGIVLWGTLAGAMLPFVLRRAGFDPAASSAPFVATLVDVTGLVIYFSVAAVLLRGTLL